MKKQSLVTGSPIATVSNSISSLSMDLPDLKSAVLLLLLFVGNAYCRPTSALSGCNPDCDPRDSFISSLPCCDKFVAEAYFMRHGSLDDSAFNDFIGHEQNVGECQLSDSTFNLLPGLTVLHRDLIGEGSHRSLYSSVGFESRRESTTWLPPHVCEAIIVERLPTGVFADPFELDHLIQRGVFTDASAFGDTNLELPSVRSNRSIVEVHLDMGPNLLSRNMNEMKLDIEVPLHARYPPLGKRGYASVEFGVPNLFTRCVFKGSSYNQSCIFLAKANSVKSAGGTIVWDVPSGIPDHKRFVSVLTFVSAVISAVSILLTCIYFSDSTVYDSTKRS